MGCMTEKSSQVLDYTTKQYALHVWRQHQPGLDTTVMMSPIRTGFWLSLGAWKFGFVIWSVERQGGQIVPVEWEAVFGRRWFGGDIL